MVRTVHLGGGGGGGGSWQLHWFAACVDWRQLMFRVWHLGQHQRGLLMAAGQRDRRTEGQRDGGTFQCVRLHLPK